MSKITSTSTIKDLKSAILRYKPDVIVMEGYNAVGKGLVTEQLLETMNYKVYRPDYNSWVQRLPREYRWVIFSSVFDVLSNLGEEFSNVVLFDRGIFSGIVYNNDMSLTEYYKSIIKNFRVLHILVTCSEEDYNKFLKVRNASKELNYENYAEYTERYIKAFQLAGADYIEYENIFMDTLNYQDTCAGCGHYTSHDNRCHNPIAIKNGIHNVSHDRVRCEYSSQREVQDSGQLQLV